MISICSALLGWAIAFHAKPIVAQAARAKVDHVGLRALLFVRVPRPPASSIKAGSAWARDRQGQTPAIEQNIVTAAPRTVSVKPHEQLLGTDSAEFVQFERENYRGRSFCMQEQAFAAYSVSHTRDERSATRRRLCLILKHPAESVGSATQADQWKCNNYLDSNRETSTAA